MNRFRYAFILSLWVSHSLMAAEEVPVTIIPLAAPLDSPEVEISGLTWCGDTLIVMPQFPDRFDDTGASYFFAIEKTAINAYLDNQNDQPLASRKIAFYENDLRKHITRFDGYEALACRGNELWLSIEVENLLSIYHGYVVKASINLASDPSEIIVKTDQLWDIDSFSKISNMGEEAMLLDRQRVITFHELNDPRLSDTARATVIDTQTKQQSTISFPHLPFRVTDSTALDENNRFWLMNYKYSGDRFSRAAIDPITDQYGEGTSHKKYYNVERLVEFELTKNGIQRIEQPPIQLLMTNVEGRNWEGLVRLDKRGFLIATDKHPFTLLGFVPFTSQSASNDD